MRTLLTPHIFSERELTCTFAICYRPSVCRLSVCNARAPYSGGSNFRQYFYGVRYLGHPLTSTENFTEMSQGNPSAGWVKHKRGSQVQRFRTYRRLYLGKWKRCKIGGKLVLITNRKSYRSFRLVPKSVTLNDLERRNSRYFALVQIYLNFVPQKYCP